MDNFLEDLWLKVDSSLEVSTEPPLEIPEEAVHLQSLVESTPVRELTPILRAAVLMRVRAAGRPKKVMLAVHATKRVDELYSRI